MIKKTTTICAVFLLLVAAGSASADITGIFVEAQIDGSNLSQPVEPTNEFSPIWNYKPFHGIDLPTADGIGGDAYMIQSHNNRNGNNEQCPLITITESELPSGIYDVYFLYYDSAGHDGWPDYSKVQAALSGQTLQTYDETTGTDTGYDNPAWSASSLREVYLGRTGVTTSISVDVDDVSGLGADTFWEGFTYELIPEPVTMSLLAIGALAALLSRRPRRYEM